eukprot:8687770-Heterocapsa_arctica.AAC.1
MGARAAVRQILLYQRSRDNGRGAGSTGPRQRTARRWRQAPPGVTPTKPAGYREDDGWRWR